MQAFRGSVFNSIGEGYNNRIFQCSIKSGTAVVHRSFQGKIPLMWLEECVKTTAMHKYALMLKTTTAL